MLELPFLALAAVFVIMWAASMVTTFLIGGLLSMEVPSWGGLVWRCAALTGVIILGAFLPVAFLRFLLTYAARCFLFQFEFPSDWWRVLVFTIAYNIMLFLLIVGAAVIFV